LHFGVSSSYFSLITPPSLVGEGRHILLCWSGRRGFLGQLSVLRGSLRIASAVTALRMMATEYSEMSKALAKNSPNNQFGQPNVGGRLYSANRELMNKYDEFCNDNCIKNIFIRCYVEVKHKHNCRKTFNAVLLISWPTESCQPRLGWAVKLQPVVV
jgi:hypothetical protein